MGTSGCRILFACGYGLGWLGCDIVLVPVTLFNCVVLVLDCGLCCFVWLLVIMILAALYVQCCALQVSCFNSVGFDGSLWYCVLMWVLGCLIGYVVGISLLAGF